VVWKLVREDKKKAPCGLRENHSGMETVIGGGYFLLVLKLRENHSGMETWWVRDGPLGRSNVA